MPSGEEVKCSLALYYCCIAVLVLRQCRQNIYSLFFHQQLCLKDGISLYLNLI